MIIRKTAVGNKEEAYIESQLVNGFNIISSDDNNKGKTIEIQSMLYALGNEPTFPKTFEYKKYYHYIEFEENDTLYFLCRHNDSFILKYDSNLMILDNVSELKRYWNKHIFKLPKITKNQSLKIVDPVLFFQLFFIGQDKNDTSNITHAGLYNKSDFYYMIFDICELSGIELKEDEISKIKSQIAVLKSEKGVLIKQYEILKSQEMTASYLSAVNDREMFAKKIANMEKTKLRITDLKKARNLTATRRAKWDTTLKELNSLNRSIEHGELRCMDCKSTNISFSSTKKDSYAFDVSSIEMRNEIINSIKEKIESYNEEIEKITSEINTAQQDLQEIMEDENISLESIVAFKQDVFNASDAEKRINEIDKELSILKDQLKANVGNNQSKKQKQEELLDNILLTMQSVYRQIDSTGNLNFDDLFTKRDEVYSGSEETIFLLSKLYALCDILHHSFPIIVDSFRAEDLSTSKEKVVIDLFKSFPNQIIFTTTLKAEEIGKYNNVIGINHIDYTEHQPSKMLSQSYTSEFMELMENLSLTI